MALVAAGRAVEPLRGVLADIRQRIERGDAFSAALASHPRTFPSVFVGVVRAGEKSGDLSTAFARLDEQLERQEKLRSRLLSASIYPMILSGMGGLSLAVLLLFVLPRFAELLEGTGASLPASTSFLLHASAGIRHAWPYAAVALLAALFGGIGFLRGPHASHVIGELLDWLPLAGALRRDLLAGRFARLLGVLLGGGAPLLAALEDTEASLSDPRGRLEVESIRQGVREGASLHDALLRNRFFPDLLMELVEVGESSGRLEEFLLKAAEIFEDRADRAMQRLVTVAEPAMILAFGGIVAFVAFSLLQAVYSVNAGTFR
jgi:general secretion pathway protein F